MPVKIKDIEKVAKYLGFTKIRQKGSHARWKHEDGRSTTIPIHGNSEIGGWLYHEIINQLGITDQEFKDILNKK